MFTIELKAKKRFRCEKVIEYVDILIPTQMHNARNKKMTLGKVMVVVSCHGELTCLSPMQENKCSLPSRFCIKREWHDIYFSVKRDISALVTKYKIKVAGLPLMNWVFGFFKICGEVEFHFDWKISTGKDTSGHKFRMSEVQLLVFTQHSW